VRGIGCRRQKFRFICIRCAKSGPAVAGRCCGALNRLRLGLLLISLVIDAVNRWRDERFGLAKAFTLICYLFPPRGAIPKERNRFQCCRIS